MLVAGLLMLTACAPAASSPAAAPAAAPANPSAAAQAPPAQVSEWDRVLEAAKREGVVSVLGPLGTNPREALTTPFEEQFGIKVDYDSEGGPNIPPKISTERGAGQYRWDIYIGGTTTALTGLRPMNVFEPMEPALLLPEVKDPTQWRGGAIEFTDDAGQVVAMSPFQRGTLFVNPTMVSPDEIKSYKDLLDPKWRGRLVIDDPRKAGSGQATFSFFYQHPELGPEFIRALARQDLVVLRDYQQEVDIIGQGRYPVLIGTDDAIAGARIEQGVRVTIIDPRQLRERSDISPASGGLAMFNNAPHPNAAKVYVNWLLSKDGQTRFVRTMGYVSNRLDVPTDHVPAWRVPIPDSIRTYTLAALSTRGQAMALFEEVLSGSR
jgi:iron(III) transport system substrate-binding protein